MSATIKGVRIRDVLRPRRQPVAEVQPDPLRTPEDAAETGLIIGMTGNQKTPWIGIAIKNLKDRRIATGERPRPRPTRAGEASGKRAGRPPEHI
jgi:hypothetical protein